MKSVICVIHVLKNYEYTVGQLVVVMEVETDGMMVILGKAKAAVAYPMRTGGMKNVKKTLRELEGMCLVMELWAGNR